MSHLGISVVAVSPTHLPNFSLRDKSKLLQLADKIEVKKKILQHQNNNNNKPDELVRAVEILTSSNGVKSAQVTSQKSMMSRKSKIYSSFQRKKTLKHDPTKTNIEHLVNNRTPIISTTPSGHANQGFVPSTPIPSTFANERLRPTKLFHSPAAQISPSAQKPSAKSCVDIIQTPVQLHVAESSIDIDSTDTSGNIDDVIIVDDLSSCKNTLNGGGLWVQTASATTTSPSLSNSTCNAIKPVTNDSSTKITISIQDNDRRRKGCGNDSSSSSIVNPLRFSSNFYANGDTIETTVEKLSPSIPQIQKTSFCPKTTQIQRGSRVSASNSPMRLTKIATPTIPPNKIIASVNSATARPRVTKTNSTGSSSSSDHPKISSAQIILLSKSNSNCNSTTTTAISPSVRNLEEEEESSKWITKSSLSSTTTCGSVPGKIGKSDDNPRICNDGKFSRPLPPNLMASESEQQSSEENYFENKRHSLPSKWNGHLPTTATTTNSSNERMDLCIDDTLPNKDGFGNQWDGNNKEQLPEISLQRHSEEQAQQKWPPRNYPSIEIPPISGKLTKNKCTSRLNIAGEDALATTPLILKPTLFQRFSKTFSLRFGGGKGRDPLGSGSSPDLTRLNRNPESRVQKSTRTDKCQSGDSGIHLEDCNNYSHPPRSQTPTTTTTTPSRSKSNLTRNHPLILDKMSIVEFPNQTWNDSSSNTSSVSSNTRKSEKTTTTTTTDDGFVSDEEGRNHVKNYRSLPMKYARQRKAEHLHGMESIRAKVIREIVTTEQSYVKTLNDIIQGYLIPCRKETGLFSQVITSNIFGNIEELLKFHLRFLDCLLTCVRHEDYEQSSVGHVFTLWVEQFELYSDYCLMYPMSMATIKQLTTNPIYEKFFEACRRLQLMDKLPLHGFLLRPIQRICQYHLQLNELVKHTGETHPDYINATKALTSMKTVALKINDTQREFDNLQEIIRLQNTVEGLEGHDLVDKNGKILQKGDLVKMGEGEKHREAYVVLLNNEILVCKRDSFKKGILNFLLRIDLSSTIWLNIDSNEEDEFFGMVHNSWRMYNPARSSWTLFTCNSPSEKKGWMESLKQAQPHALDYKMIEMAKLTAQVCSEEHPGITVRHRKSRKSLKLNSDEMLIEVSKLKTTSKFYV